MTREISLHNSWMGLMEHRLSPSCRRSNLSRPIHQRRDASVGGTFYNPVTLSSDLNKWVVARSDTSAHAGRRRRCPNTRGTRTQLYAWQPVAWLRNDRALLVAPGFNYELSPADTARRH